MSSSTRHSLGGGRARPAALGRRRSRRGRAWPSSVVDVAEVLGRFFKHGLTRLTNCQNSVVKLLWNVRECRTCVVNSISNLEIYCVTGIQRRKKSLKGENDFFRNGLRSFLALTPCLFIPASLHLPGKADKTLKKHFFSCFCIVSKILALFRPGSPGNTLAL